MHTYEAENIRPNWRSETFYGALPDADKYYLLFQFIPSFTPLSNIKRVSCCHGMARPEVWKKETVSRHESLLQIFYKGASDSRQVCDESQWNKTATFQIIFKLRHICILEYMTWSWLHYTFTEFKLLYLAYV